MTNVLSSGIEVKNPNEVSLIVCLFQPVFSPGLLKELEERHNLFFKGCLLLPTISFHTETSIKRDRNQGERELIL